MIRKIVKRILFIIPTIILISLLSFALLYFAPGNTALLILQEKTHSATITKSDAEAFAESQGLNAGFAEMYANWFGGVLRGDLGTSYVDGGNVNQQIIKALQRTAIMVLIAWLTYTVMGTLMGVLSAVYHNGILDRITKYWAVLSTAIPVFWIGLFVVRILSVGFGFVTVGKRSDLCLILPGVLMGLVYTGNLIVIAKEKTRMVLEAPYVLGARAMGVKRGVILRTHVLKNILAPVISTSTLAFSNLIGSSILMESIFSISGFGTLLTNAIGVKDYMVVASATLVIGILVSVVNMLADISYSFIDRREGIHET